jgi:hypothetical protein
MPASAPPDVTEVPPGPVSVNVSTGSSGTPCARAQSRTAATAPGTAVSSGNRPPVRATPISSTARATRPQPPGRTRPRVQPERCGRP